jgi:putative ABC transport system substrate-binding protein
MRRRDFLALAGAATTFPHVALAELPARVPTIVVLSNNLSDNNRRSLLVGLADFGYVDGKNIAIEFLTAPTIADVPAYAAQAVARKPDLIITAQSPAPVALKELTSTIPVVMTGLNDPVAIGVVPNYMRPGGNMTGPMTAAPDALGKMLELIREVMPGLARLGVMGLPEDPVYPILLGQVVETAKAFNISTIALGTKENDDFEALFARAKNDGAQAIFVFNGNYLKTLPVSARLTELAIRNKLPIFSNTVGAAREGGMLIGYSGEGFAMNPEINNYRRTGYYVDLILKGAKPGDLPIEGPTNYSLVINLKTAKEIGVAIPQPVLFQATEVIQ